MKTREAHLALLVDFGSTYTKLVAVDLDAMTIVGQAQAPTTVETDVNVGLWQGLARLEREFALPPDRFTLRLACSSAAGGLRVIAIGLVRSLTVEAARQAALGAGARIAGAFGDTLTAQEIEEIADAQPDLILLAGGTDGGDRATLLHNAARLAESAVVAPIVLAGNKDGAPQAEQLLRDGGKEVRAAANVLPRLNEIDVEPARAAIRRLYMERIVAAKGLSRAEAFIGRVVMPTPAAVLRAARLLAEGTAGWPGWESVMVVDIGGATTDVHSIAPDRPAAECVIRHGLPEPHAKRTVEGDLGLRVSAVALLESLGAAALRAELDDALPAGSADDADSVLRDAIQRRATETGLVPTDAFERRLDAALAHICAATGTARHVGRLREHYTASGYCLVQDGKDLTQIAHLVGTGGIFVHTAEPARILAGALFDPQQPHVLRPARPELHVDRDYVLWAMGLLADSHPDVALDILARGLPVIARAAEEPSAPAHGLRRTPPDGRIE